MPANSLRMSLNSSNLIKEEGSNELEREFQEEEKKGNQIQRSKKDKKDISIFVVNIQCLHVHLVELQRLSSHIILL